MAIEIMQKPKTKLPTWVKILLGAAIGFVLIAAGMYFYLDYSSKKVTREINDTQAQITALVNANRETEKRVLTYEAKINDFSSLVSSHQKTVNVLTFLEQKTHPEVMFKKLNFDAAKTVLSVEGKAASFTALGQQMLILKEEKVLKNINLSGIALSPKEGITFSLQLTFDSQIIK